MGPELCKQFDVFTLPDPSNISSNQVKFVANTVNMSDQEMLSFLSGIELQGGGIFPSGEEKVQNFGCTQQKNHVPGNRYPALPLPSIPALQSNRTKRKNDIPVSLEDTMNSIPVIPFTPSKVSSLAHSQIPDETKNIPQNHTEIPGIICHQSSNMPSLPIPSRACLESITEPAQVKENDNQNKKAKRNLREQQRSHRINEEISELRKLLLESGVKFDKTNKYSTLMNVHDFIIEQQNRFAQLDFEYRKLNDELNDAKVVNKHNAKQSQSHVVNFSRGVDSLASGPNYYRIFSRNPVALAVVSLDGRFLDCNDEFELITGFRKEDLLNCQINLSLFHLLDKPENVKQLCKAMRKLIQEDLKEEESDSEIIDSSASSSAFSSVTDFEVNGSWRGSISSKKKPDVNLIITITLSKSKRFFHCTFSSEV